MAAIMKYYIKTIFKKQDKERSFWVNIYKALYFTNNAVELDLTLFQMFVYGLTKKDSMISR